MNMNELIKSVDDWWDNIFFKITREVEKFILRELSEVIVEYVKCVPLKLDNEYGYIDTSGGIGIDTRLDCENNREGAAGMKEGPWILYVTPTTYVENFFVRCKRHSKRIVWKNNSKVIEEDYTDGKRNGTRTLYFKSGVKALEEIYEMDKRISKTLWSADGNVKFKESKESKERI